MEDGCELESQIMYKNTEMCMQAHHVKFEARIQKKVTSR